MRIILLDGSSAFYNERETAAPVGRAQIVGSVIVQGQILQQRNLGPLTARFPREVVAVPELHELM